MGPGALDCLSRHLALKRPKSMAAALIATAGTVQRHAFLMRIRHALTPTKGRPMDSINNSPRAPLQQNNATPPVNASPTSEETFDRWNKSLQRVPLSTYPSVQTLLKEISLGCVAPDTDRVMQTLFTLLIENEAFDVLPEILNAFTDIKTRQLAEQGDHAAYTLALTLWLPSDWTPEHTSMDKMVEAFRRIRVQEMEVASTTQDNMAPAAVSHCLVALLKGGTTTLHLHAALTSPFMVAQALPDSQLQSITLGDRKGHAKALPHEHLTGYEAILRGLAQCSTLQHLTIGHSDLTVLHGVFDYYDTRPGASLTSVTLQGYPKKYRMATAHEPTERFVAAISTLSSLTAVKVQLHAATPERIHTNFLAPLAGHAQLTRLDIEGRLAVESFNNPLAQWTVEFIASCPSLTHLHLPACSTFSNQHAQAVDRLNIGRRLGTSLDPIKDLANVKRLFAKKKQPLPLKSLSMDGVFISRSVWRTILAMIAPGAALGNLKALSLKNCIFDLPVTLEWTRTWAANPLLQTVVLPDPDGYCLTTKGGDLQGFREPGTTLSLRGVLYVNTPTRFQLDSDSDIGIDAKAEATATFAKIEDLANTLLIAPQKRLDELRKSRLNAPASLGLEHQLAHFMATAYAASLDVAPKTIKENAFLFANPHMVNDIGTSSAAQLLNVNRHLHLNPGDVSIHALRSLLEPRRRDAQGEAPTFPEDEPDADAAPVGAPEGHDDTIDYDNDTLDSDTDLTDSDDDEGPLDGQRAAVGTTAHTPDPQREPPPG